MQTYEYQCKSCEHRFEVWQKMTDEALTICPECKGPIRRVLFPAGIVFKGSGFYKTDHGSGAVIRTIPVGRGDYRGPVMLASIGSMVLEQRGPLVVALR